MFELLKRSHNLKHDAEMVRLLIKHGYTTLLPETYPADIQLTSQELNMLESWAVDRPDIIHLNEIELGEVLLAENSHVWPWLRRKLVESVAHLLELRSKRN